MGFDPINWYKMMSKVFVLPHNPKWKDDFEVECKLIGERIANPAIIFHHIGSTAIPGIFAKPIIDIMGVVTSFDQLDAQSDKFELIGYEVMGELGIAERRYYRKITSDGIRTHHLHVFLEGSNHIDRHLAFRDYLKTHQSEAKLYSDLKLRLLEQGNLAWDEYIQGKEAFIQETEKKAQIWYKSLRC